MLACAEFMCIKGTKLSWWQSVSFIFVVISFLDPLFKLLYDIWLIFRVRGERFLVSFLSMVEKLLTPIIYPKLITVYKFLKVYLLILHTQKKIFHLKVSFVNFTLGSFIWVLGEGCVPLTPSARNMVTVLCTLP